jgi:hypothetical protein
LLRDGRDTKSGFRDQGLVHLAKFTSFGMARA